MTIITFPDRNAPDPNCTSGDKHRYSMAYTLGDSEYSFDIWARSMQDAEAHCAAIRSGVEVCGQLVRVDGDG